jgi:hypothetical protein
MPDHTVIRFPAGRTTAPGYTDTAALNDIHAILCCHSGWSPGTLEEVAEVLARCGRPVMAVRDIEAAAGQTPAGLPQARVDAGGTEAEVYQDQSGGLVVAITATGADEASLLVTLNEHQLHPAAGRQP